MGVVGIWALVISQKCFKLGLFHNPPANTQK